jgi:hypothetical protein
METEHLGNVGVCEGYFIGLNCYEGVPMSTNNNL